MSRDNALSVVIGILVGFIAGYLLHEVMAARQPARLVHGEAGPVAPGDPGGASPQSQTQARAQAEAEARVQEIRSLEAYLVSNPGDADAVRRLASLSFRVGSWGRCVDLYERYLELRPEEPEVLLELGVCYRSFGRLDRSLELFDRAQQLEPDHWQSRFYEALVLGIDQGNFEAAEQVMEELRALQPNNPEVEALAEEIARRRSAA